MLSGEARQFAGYLRVSPECERDLPAFLHGFEPVERQSLDGRPNIVDVFEFDEWLSLPPLQGAVE